MKVLLIAPSAFNESIRAFAAELDKKGLETQLFLIPANSDKPLAWYAVSGVCKIFETPGYYAPMQFVEKSFDLEFSDSINAVENRLALDPDCTALAIGRPAVSVLMKAAQSHKNRAVFYENGDSVKLMFNRYGKRFIEKYYSRADVAVFADEESRRAYPHTVSENGIIIKDLTSPESIEKWAVLLN